MPARVRPISAKELAEFSEVHVSAEDQRTHGSGSGGHGASEPTFNGYAWATTHGFGGGGSLDYAPGGGGYITNMIADRLRPPDTGGSNGRGFPDMRALSIQPAWMSGGGNGGALGLWLANPAFLEK